MESEEKKAGGLRTSGPLKQHGGEFHMLHFHHVSQTGAGGASHPGTPRAETTKPPLKKKKKKKLAPSIQKTRKRVSSKTKLLYNNILFQPDTTKKSNSEPRLLPSGASGFPLLHD